MVKRIRSVNGFIVQKSIVKGERGVKIIFLMNGVFYAQSEYPIDVSDEQEKELNDKLQEYTDINRQAKTMYDAVPLTTMIKSVADIILN